VLKLYQQINIVIIMINFLKINININNKNVYLIKNISC